MTDDLASAKLGDFLVMLQQTLRPPSTPHSTDHTSDPSDGFLQLENKLSRQFNKGCTPFQVFGCEYGGVLPATYYQDPNHDVCYPYQHASPLNPTLSSACLHAFDIATLS